MIKQGQHLKEVNFNFLVKDGFDSSKAVNFLNEIVKEIKMKKVFEHVNLLPPGFDVLFGIKESFMYLGYWGEVKYVRLTISSCKKFSTNSGIKIIKKLNLLSKIITVVNENNSISKIEKELLLWSS